jgi:hypothetical protein
VAYPSGVTSTIAGGDRRGFADAIASAARFSGASALALDPDARTLFVADTLNNRLRSVSLASGAVRTLAGGGTATLLAGSPAADGTGTAATLLLPAGVAWVPERGVLLVTEAAGHRLRALDPTTLLLSTLAGGDLGQAGSVDGFGPGALLHAPAGLAASPGGGARLAYLADTGSHVIRGISLAGVAELTLTITATGVPFALGSTLVTGAYDVLYGPGGRAADFGDVLNHAGEEHSITWCAYDDSEDSGSGAGTLVLRGAVNATLAALDANGTAHKLMAWRGDGANDVRVVPLALPRPGCTQPDAVNYNPFATEEPLWLRRVARHSCCATSRGPPFVSEA